MKKGDFILENCRAAPRTERTVALIRHAERESFAGIPEHLREDVAITPAGIRMATSFGASLGEIFPGRRILLGHTVARRCRMTAESIAAGHPDPDLVRILGCLPEVGTVVVDQQKYVEVRDRLAWDQLVLHWLHGEIAGDTLQDPATYCRELLMTLQSVPVTEDGDLLVVIAHDVTILPVVSSLFGQSLTWIDFLNGITISCRDGSTEIRYSDAARSLQAAWRP